MSRCFLSSVRPWDRSPVQLMHIGRERIGKWGVGWEIGVERREGKGREEEKGEKGRRRRRVVGKERQGTMKWAIRGTESVEESEGEKRRDIEKKRCRDKDQGDHWGPNCGFRSYLSPCGRSHIS